MKFLKLLALCLAITMLLCLGFTGCADKNAPNVKIPAGCRLAYSDVLDYYFAYPATVWLPGENGGFLSVVKSGADNDFSSVVVNSWEVEVPVGAKDYWVGINNEKPEGEGATITDPDSVYGGYEYTLSSIVDGYTVVEAKSETVGGFDAYRVVYTGKIAGSEYKIMQVTVARIVGSKTVIYEITYTSTPEFFDSNLDGVETMISSFGVRD